MNLQEAEALLETLKEKRRVLRQESMLVEQQIDSLFKAHSPVRAGDIVMIASRSGDVEALVRSVDCSTYSRIGGKPFRIVVAKRNKSERTPWEVVSCE